MGMHELPVLCCTDVNIHKCWLLLHRFLFDNETVFTQPVRKVEIFLHLNYKNVFSSNKLFNSNNLYCRTDAAECFLFVKCGLGVTQGRWKWYHLKAWVRFPVATMAVCLAVWTPLPPLGYIWDVMLVCRKGNIEKTISVFKCLVYYDSGTQRYEQFLQVGRLILFGLALCLPSASVSSVFTVLYIHRVSKKLCIVQPAQSPSLRTKCNSPSINGQCINFVLFDVAL